MMSSASSPFVLSSHGHPSFNPVKVGGRSSTASESRTPKPPKPPEKPLMPYMRYSRKIYESMKARNPDVKFSEVGKIAGQKWRDLPDEEKKVYFDAFEIEKNEYNEALRNYHNSPAYQSYLAAKIKAREFGEKELTSTSNKRQKDSNVGQPSPSKAQEGKICIQQLEEEEEVDEFSIKQIAEARYVRNHKLINEIFSDTVVPDVRSVVTTARMQILKRQVQSLTMHQKKLEAELQQIEEKFEAKKRKFVEASDAFQEEMKRRCAKKPVDESAFQAMVDKCLEQFKKEHAMKMELERKRQEVPTAVQPPPPAPLAPPAPPISLPQPAPPSAQQMTLAN